MKKLALLILNNGKLFVGQGLGMESIRYGECVFTTSMTGYSESLTDPSYAGQILCFSYPEIGNYGVSKDWFESPYMYAEGCILSNYSLESFHSDKTLSLDEFLISNQKAAIFGIDTRYLVKTLRDEGNQPCILVVGNENKIREYLANIKAGISFEALSLGVENPQDINFTNWLERVNDRPGQINTNQNNQIPAKLPKTVIVIDCGAKANIIRELNKRFENIIILPSNSSVDKIRSLNPDAILLSNGPGDPRDYHQLIKTVEALLQINLPIMGICLGHQILSLAIGCKVYKMKFGNRGPNQPVQNFKDKRAYLTSQNHGYAIVEESIPEDYEVFFKNLNDQTVEGINHKIKPIFSVQFHPEACGGPQDSNWLFDKFAENVISNS